ncbi:Chaperone protein ClpB [Cucumispora dikerogammari]|nr:Chaperone protein ClpB [Cucumispora dikerogammari]
MNVTKEVEQIFEKSINTCKTFSHQKMQPEHIFYSVLNYLPKFPKKAELKKRIENYLEAQPKISPVTEVQYTIDTINILNDLTNTQQTVTIDILIKELIRFYRLKQLLNEILTPEELKTLEATNSSSVELSEYTTNMVEEAKSGRYDPVIGRVQEIRSIIEILSKKTKSNVILVGDPGVGKTAVVQGLAQLIANGEASNLNGYDLLSVDITGIVAGTGVKGEFEKRMKSLLEEVESKTNIVLFIDEIHMALNAGSSGSGSAMDMGNIIKPALARGLKCIGATTNEEYRKYIENDPAFSRRFMKLNIDEPSIEDALTMLRGIKERFEAFHGIHIRDDALKFSVNCKKYLSGRRLPDLAIDLIDTACASKIIESNLESGELMNLKEKLWSLKLEKATIEIDYNRLVTVPSSPEHVDSTTNDSTKSLKLDTDLKDISELKKRLENISLRISETEELYKTTNEEFEKEKTNIFKLKTMRQELEKYNLQLETAKRENNFLKVADLTKHTIPFVENKIKELKKYIQIIADDVASVVSKWTKIPVTRLSLKDNERLTQMFDRISSKVFGQEHVIYEVVNSLTQSRLGLNDPNKPLSFLFLGPTGVGKTELAKCLAYELFDSESKLTVLDMSDYANEISVTKLIGAPAGYIGYEEGGTLTEPVKQKPYNVVLFDELDLAHEKVLNILYQLLDEGRVTDGKRNVIDFKNTIIIMTSNIGSEEILNSIKSEESGNLAGAPILKDESIILNKLNSKFGMALTNRIDKILYFNKMDVKILKNIFDSQLKILNRRLFEKKLQLVVDNKVKRLVIEKSYTPNFGARPVKREVQRFMDGVTQIILQRGVGKTEHIRVSLDEENGGLRVGDLYYSYI